ncbi:MAG: SHOCT domain-containing protein [Lachnospiraceae bacterium]|nr:SHOCT domain-containing protein [Lachnospiraceae bacterium]
MEEYYIYGLFVAALLGLIPANIAKNKGYSFGLWWFYGWMLFVVAIIHVSLIKDKKEEKWQQEAYARNAAAVLTAGQAAGGQAINNVAEQPSQTEELKRFKELLDMGVISEEDFQRKKAQILGFSLESEKSNQTEPPLLLPRRNCHACQTPFRKGDEIIICPRCRKEHHVGCWIARQGCATPGCPG